ncbi:SMP-30/gluconolactonase/LRE family protein [Povalibacter sp.]|uniref:SMP-30/gluconolactonase/LRE family protein n=1 Tax=Povalibacter sp. TaxID=1962978 RepID=UPI002F42B0E2
MIIAPHIRCQLGEGLLWSARESAVYWVDIIGQRVHRYSLADGATKSWTMPQKTGWLVERRAKPGFIAGMQSGFVELTLDPLMIRPIADPEPHLPDNRMNDCCVDHHGNIWAGTMDVPIEKATGSLYRLDSAHQVTKHDSDYLVTNGPAFSPARDYMYHNDTGRGVVYRFDVAVDGSIANKREFIRFREDWGVPDGMTVDAEGCLWIAHWGGSCVSRFTPDGERQRWITLPASQITNCMFAGDQLDRLFVTSAADGKPDEPLAGSLFEVDSGGVTGLAPNLFAG